MAEKTEISWTDATFNPWIGCTKVSPGCDNCYAAQQDSFRKWTPEGWGAGKPRKRTKTWDDPVKWNVQPFAECMECGWRGESRRAVLVENPPGFHPPVASVLQCPGCSKPLLKAARRRVFCASLGDVFDNEVDPQWRSDLFALIRATPNLDWLLLTKRIGNALDMLPWASRGAPGNMVAGGMIRPNVWLGATIVNQEEADRDIPKLLATPARVRFLSMEPLLGPVNLGEWLWACCGNTGTGAEYMGQREEVCCGKPEPRDLLDWVIVGGESGPHARPMHLHWARSLRDQCEAAGVPLHFKQWGEWMPVPSDDDPLLYGPVRVGKHAAGRLLDGVEHNGFPEVVPNA